MHGRAMEAAILQTPSIVVYKACGVKMSNEQNGDTKMEAEEEVPEETKEEQTKEEDLKDDKDGEVKEAEEQVEEEEEEEESSDEEELPLGSVEAPVQLMEGKRDRKKVERLVMAEPPKTPEKKFEIPEGKGTKLGEIPVIKYQLEKFKADVLKPLHRFLFGKVVKDFDTKRNIRQFSGFNFEKDDTEYTKRETILGRFTVDGIKELCTILDLEKKGKKEQIMDRIMDFCLKPEPSGRMPPEKGKKGTSKTQKKKSKTKKKKTEGSAKKKKTKAGGDASAVSEDGDSAIEDEAEGGSSVATESDSSPKKKKKSTPKPKKKDTSKKGTPQKKKLAVKSPSKSKKSSPSPKKTAKKTPQKRKQDDFADDSDSDDEPLVKKSKQPPSDAEIKKTVVNILEGANLEEVTMKMVCRRVYDTYPDFQLQHKKDFIKSTVREIIS